MDGELQGAKALERKKAEVEELLERFTLHMTAAEAITREIARTLDSFKANYGAAGIPVAMELFNKFCSTAEKFRGREHGGPTSAPV
jgi:hypothetical protein